MNIAEDLLAWHLADSAFPTGAFAHSGGLESAWQQGAVDPERLEKWLAAQLNAWKWGVVPFVLTSYHNLDALDEVDRDCDCFLNNHVANRASRAQGHALLHVVSRIFNAWPDTGSTLESLRARLRRDHLPGHLAPVFGASMRILDLSAARTVRLFLFTQLRSSMSAAVRLGIVGPLEGQSIQVGLLPLLEQLTHSSVTDEQSEPMQTAPWMDLLQGAQDRLYTRLFQS